MLVELIDSELIQINLDWECVEALIGTINDYWGKLAVGDSFGDLCNFPTRAHMRFTRFVEIINS